MTRYIVMRLLALIPTLLAIAVLMFFMLELVPGDPVTWLLGQEVSGDAIEAKRKELGLDRPVLERLLNWFGDLLRGDLGDSLFLEQSVRQALAERYPVTLTMTALALLLAVAVGVPTGIIASVNQGRLADWLTMLLTLGIMSVPSFWFALNLIFLFVAKLKWFPVGGYVPFSEDPLSSLHHLALPCFSLGMGAAGWIARMTRTSMLEVLRSDYVRTAQAKGLAERVVVYRHAFKNAAIPILTMIGMVVTGLLGGSVLTETVFALPGLGRLVVDAVARRDYFVIQGAVLVIMLVALLVDLVVDVLYVWLDPRIRYDE